MNTTDRHNNILAAARREAQQSLLMRLASRLRPSGAILVIFAVTGCWNGCTAGRFYPAVRAISAITTGALLGRDAKLRIGARTAALIPDNASIFLNIGTTTEAVAHALCAHRDLMVVTNNLNVANILARNPSCDVVVAGETLRRTDGGLVGDLAALAIARFKVDIAIIGASAIDPSGDLLDFDPE